jgi:translation initiation factor 4A
LEAQLKALPLIHDILDRLVRCEYSTREIQRDLGDVHRKVNLLVERSLNVSNNATINSQPEFKDPFAPSNANAQPFNPPPLSGPRGSVGGIAPNQISSSDDIGQISQRLNTLTTSVGQLLALQTQQHIQSTNTALPNGQMGGNNQQQQQQQQDLAPNQMLSPPLQSGMVGHGLPNRPDMRGPPGRASNPPMRTWSAGNLDLPMRPSESGSLGRSNDILNKRRSVTSGAVGGTGLMRRESAGVRA